MQSLIQKVQGDLADGVGAVWGLNVDVLPKVRDKRILKFQMFIARQCFTLRGGTHDALIPQKAVDGLQIPDQLHTYEDAYIMRWRKAHGYKIVVATKFTVAYKPPENWQLQNGIAQAIVEFK